MKKTLLLVVLCLTSALTAFSAIDLTQIEGRTWNPREVYTIGTDDATWNLNQYGSSGLSFTLQTDHYYTPSGYESVFNINSPSGAELNAWVCSPAILFKKGYTYQVTYWYKNSSSSSKIALKCWLDTEKGTADLETATAMEKKTVTAKNDGYPTSWTKITFEYAPEEDIVQFLNYQAYASQWATSSGYMYLGMFEVKIIKSEAQPLAPTEVVATPAAEGEIKADISWTLPTHNVGGGLLTGNNAIENVLVYRDGEVVAALPPTAVAWTDTEETGLQRGDYVYQVAVTSAGELGILSEPAPKIHVGPFMYNPKEVVFSDDEWTCYTITGQPFTANSTYVEDPYTNAASFWAYSATQEDAWLCSPPLTLDTEKTYKVRFNYMTWDDKDCIIEHLNVYIAGCRANENTVASILETEPIVSIDNIKHVANQRWRTVEVSGVKFTNETSHVLFHVFGTVCKRFSINGLEVEEYKEIPFAPAAPTSLAANVAPYQQLMVDLTWENPTTAADGTVLQEDQTITAVRIVRDGEVIFTSEDVMTEFTDSEEYGLTSGTHEYAVAVCVADAWSEPSEVITTKRVGVPETQTLPWSPQLSSLTSEMFDQWWVSYPSQNDIKWLAGPLGIRFANTSGESEDCWLIGAPLNLEGESTAFKLSYRIDTDDAEGTKISVGLTNTAMPEEFTHLIADNVVFGEEQSVSFTYAVTRAATMPRLAFRAYSASGTRDVTLSNLVLEFDKQTGIENVAISENSDMQVYDLNGRVVGKTSSLELEGFAKGIYIVTYVSDGKPVRIKVVK